MYLDTISTFCIGSTQSYAMGLSQGVDLLGRIFGQNTITHIWYYGEIWKSWGGTSFLANFLGAVFTSLPGLQTALICCWVFTSPDTKGRLGVRVFYVLQDVMMCSNTPWYIDDVLHVPASYLCQNFIKFLWLVCMTIVHILNPGNQHFSCSVRSSGFLTLQLWVTFMISG